ncbi:MAG: hypothetical protein KatS3mg003_1760 [Candidatus Nitrosocaldaceae archaeon]|nr:MAG: hypothetical protein KatS3mg003_1760 [Candidatus Nitrosocaldaceae archaeon]
MYKHILISILIVSIIPINIHAQESELIFKNVIIDNDLQPLKLFSINAIISNTARGIVYENVLVKIVVPSKINVIDNIIKNLDNVEYGIDKVAKWTLLASEPGSFNIKLFLYSDGKEMNTFDITINVGVSKSIVLYDIDLPGNIRIGNTFNYTIVVKNVAAYKIDNVIFSIGLGTGLHALDEITKTVDIEPQESIKISWLIRADAVGSFKIVVNYFTQYNESETFETFVNIGGIVNIGNILSRAYWGIDKETIALPGSRNIPLTIILTNIGEAQLNDIIVEVNASKPLSIDDNTRKIQVIQPDKNISLTFLANIDKDAEIGLYPIHVTLRSETYNQEKTDEIFVAITKNIPVIVTLDDVDRNDNILTVNLTIYNNSSQPLHNFKIFTNDTLAQTLKSPVIDILDAYERREIVLEMLLRSNNYETILPLNIIMSYFVNGILISNNNILNIPITEDLYMKTPFIISSLSTEPSIVYSGDFTHITINIYNNDLFTYNNVYAKLIMENGFTSSSSRSDESYISVITPSTEYSLNFSIKIEDNVNSGEYIFKLLLKYNNQTLEYDIPFIVYPKANFDVLSVDSSQLYIGNTNVPLKVTLKNVGNADAYNVKIKLLGGNELPGSKSTVVTTVGDTELIGKINKDQVVTATFIVNVDNSANVGNNIIDLEISWDQNDGNSFTDIVPFAVHVNSTAVLHGDSFSNIILILLTAIVSSIIVLTFVYLRNKKMNITQT